MTAQRQYLLLALCLTACSEPDPPSRSAEDRLNPLALLAGDAQSGFRLAQHAREFEFPADHGPHEGFRNEWWYLTGNLKDAQNREYGYQVTFFRHALHPAAPEVGASAWRGNTAWMAHVAFTEVSTGQHRHAERFSRESPGLAGASAAPFEVWLEDWRLAASEDPAWLWTLEATVGETALSLRLRPEKPPVLQGDAGLSRKNAEAGNASYYYSLTRIASEGEIRLGEESRAVSGTSWLDREWSSSALGEDQSGWDWFSLRFDDGRELMYYRLRDLSGGTHRFSAGNLTDRAARQHALAADDVKLVELADWQAPSGRHYTTDWHVELGTESWRVRALVDAQWMDLSVEYWEGAVEVLDPDSGERRGLGYLEMVRDVEP